jgi:three-Cys-motif partner protein
MTKRQKKVLKFDEIGYWSEIKLDIIREYAKAYSTIFGAQRQARFYHVFIDAFAGAGIHLSKTREEAILGSPLIALNTEPPFREYHFIDLDGSKANHLRSLIGNRPDVQVYPGDCNRIMLEHVLPTIRYEDFRRGLCLLDPYGLHLNWEVIRMAGQMETIDLFLNFPIMDINMNVVWHRPENVDADDIARMNAFWGDDTWRQVAYEVEQTLFGPKERKAPNESIAEAFRQRLADVGGFARVPPPIPIRNTRGAIVYYLFFASQNEAGERIARAIFNKYRDQGAV